MAGYPQILPEPIERMNGDAAFTILVVEDDPEVRKVVTAQLGSMGHAIVEAENAASAIDILRSDRRIDLLFTDVVMPGDMSGLDLGARAQELRPGLTVLYTSGFTETALQDNVHVARVRNHLITKPYRLRDLARKVSEILSADKSSGA